MASCTELSIIFWHDRNRVKRLRTRLLNESRKFRETSVQSVPYNNITSTRLGGLRLIDYASHRLWNCKVLLQLQNLLVRQFKLHAPLIVLFSLTQLSQEVKKRIFEISVIVSCRPLVASG